MERLELPYYYGQEAMQHTFYRIPKVLFTDARLQGIATDSKVLYGLLLDRMSLSIEHGWVDEDGKVFIYFPVEEAAQLLGCGKDKILKLFAELDSKKGIGLIERKRQGQGKPTRMYVKKFYAEDS